MLKSQASSSKKSGELRKPWSESAVMAFVLLTFTILGVSDASDSKSGSSMTNESICWATGASGSVSESSALGVLPFFLPRCRDGCSAAGVKVREMAAAVWPLGSGVLDATFGFVMWITGLKRGNVEQFTLKYTKIYSNILYTFLLLLSHSSLVDFYSKFLILMLLL